MEKKIEVSNIRGLSVAQAAALLAKNGYNELPSAKKRSLLAIIFEVVREPMFLLLLASGSIYFLFGDIEEGAMLLGFVFVVIGITLCQERKSERALEALRDLSSPRALVIRDGQQMRIPGREVVQGDFVVIFEGDRIPADAVIRSSLNLSVDESLLTGESVPVRKVACDSTKTMNRPGGEDSPFAFSGTLVVQGWGVGEVLATGAHTEIGKIGRALQTIEPEKTLLQKETGLLVKRLAIAGLSLCGIVTIVYGLTRGDWLNGILAGITLAMATLPEEFPVVLTVFLALGAWRIAQKRVLTRRVPAVETLGSASVLCVDKTGTLTMNQMSVQKIFTLGKFYDIPPKGQQQGSPSLPEEIHAIVEYSILASQEKPFDPMEKAFRELGEAALANTEHLHNDWHLIQEYPLSKELLAMSRAWQSPDAKDYVIASKGAPEAIADICHMTEREIGELKEQITLLAKEGLRVLGVARSLFKREDLPKEQHDFKFEFLGLIGLADPVRPGVAAAIKECYQAGVRVVMITGDYPVTAQNIAAQIGLKNIEGLITGQELEKMDPAELQRRIKTTSIFARVVPEQKMLIVNALKAAGEVVAMTGDGVNDAAALKSAHIGIAMGGRGTDVAREASAIVLLDDDFSSIVQAVRMGRRIFDNLKKAMAYILAVHVPIAGMSLIPVFFGWPLVLLPMHIVFLELIIDPACSVVFEAEREEKNIMNRPPRDLAVPLFNQRTVILSLLQGLSVLAIVCGVFVTAMHRGLGELDARALCFITLVVSNLGLILTNRSWSSGIIDILKAPNAAFWWVLGGVTLSLWAVIYLPLLRNLFRFSALHVIDLAICLAAGIVSVLWFEVFKFFARRRASRI